MLRPAVAIAASLLAILADIGAPLAQTTYQPSAQPGLQPAAPPQPVSRTQHGVWEVLCYTAGDCIMTQFHRRTETSADVVFTIAKPQGLPPDETGQPIEAIAEIVVPLGVFLPAGLGLKVDNDPAKAAPYERCIPDGCVVRAPISSAMIARLKAGGTANVVIAGAPERQVIVPISLSGFTAAYDSF